MDSNRSYNQIFALSFKEKLVDVSLCAYERTSGRHYVMFCELPKGISGILSCDAEDSVWRKHTRDLFKSLDTFYITHVILEAQLIKTAKRLLCTISSSSYNGVARIIGLTWQIPAVIHKKTPERRAVILKQLTSYQAMFLKGGHSDRWQDYI